MSHLKGISVTPHHRRLPPTRPGHLKQIGLGLAVAVLIDATVVRLVMVPAVMELLGPANWWLPGWLDRRLPARHPGPPGGDEPPAGTPADDRAAAEAEVDASWRRQREQKNRPR